MSGHRFIDPVLAQRPGDLIHFLRKDIVNRKDQNVTYREGTILVRRHGETKVASHDERLMLQRRVRAGADLLEGVTVLTGPSIEVSPLAEQRLRQALAEERDRLLAARYEPGSGGQSMRFQMREGDRRTFE